MDSCFCTLSQYSPQLCLLEFSAPRPVPFASDPHRETYPLCTWCRTYTYEPQELISGNPDITGATYQPRGNIHSDSSTLRKSTIMSVIWSCVFAPFVCPWLQISGMGGA